jgi:hypothetical protein
VTKKFHKNGARTLGYPEANAQFPVEHQPAGRKVDHQQQQQARRVSMEHMDLIKMTPG